MSATVVIKFVVCLGAAAAIGVSGSVSAQQRTPNGGATGVLRTWPGNADWQVAMTRLADGALGCVLLTGHTNPASGERYLWGIRWRDNSLAATIVDSNQQAVAGSTIAVTIDQVPVGTYQITRRLGPDGGMQSVTAELPAPDKDRLASLIGVGGPIQFVTANSTYSAPLLARISHKKMRIGAPNQRKLLCRNDIAQIRGTPRCRQSVTRNHLILEPWKVAVWKRHSMAGWSPPTQEHCCWERPIERSE